MRDPARIDRVIELLRAAWHASPDLRLGQLISNLTANDRSIESDSDIHNEIWCREDDHWEASMREWIGDRR